MKILFNSYPEFTVKNKPVYGGPRIFAKLFMDYCQKNNLTYAGLIARKDNKIDGDFQVTHSKNSQILLKLNFDSKKFFRTRQTKVPVYFDKYIDIIAEQITAARPDIVLLMGFSFINWMTLKAARKAGIPVINTHLGLWYKEIENLSALITPQSRNLAREMEKDISRLAQCEIFLNDYSRKLYSKELIKTKNAVVIPLPYDRRYLTPRPHRKKRRTHRNIGMIGRWDLIKNPEAFYNLAKESYQQKLPWQFYAIMKIQPTPGLKHLEKKYSDYVHIMRPMHSHGVKRFIHEMDVLVLPSHFDVSPNVVMEGILAHKMTLISPNVGWVDEYSKLGVRKWITKFEDPEKVIDLLESLSHAIPPKKLYNYIKAKHSPTSVFDEYLKLFKSLR